MFSCALTPANLIRCQQLEMQRSCLVSFMDKTTYFILIDSLWIYMINQYKSPGEHLQGSESMIQTARRHGQLLLKVAAGK